jgi:hypothetical protein
MTCISANLRQFEESAMTELSRKDLPRGQVIRNVSGGNLQLYLDLSLPVPEVGQLTFLHFHENVARELLGSSISPSRSTYLRYLTCREVHMLMVHT